MVLLLLTHWMVMPGHLQMHVASYHLPSAQQTLMKMPQSQVEEVALHSDLLLSLPVQWLLQDQIAVVQKHVIHELQGVAKKSSKHNKITKCGLLYIGQHKKLIHSSCYFGLLYSKPSLILIKICKMLFTAEYVL
jgi:hypothetical protein